MIDKARNVFPGGVELNLEDRRRGDALKRALAQGFSSVLPGYFVPHWFKIYY